MQSLEKFRAVVFGVNGGIGSAVFDELKDARQCVSVHGLSRNSEIPIDLEVEATIEKAAEEISKDGPVHLLFDATGLLHDDVMAPEKSLAAFDPASAARAFAVNATGPLLLLKHFHHLMPRNERAVFASISARVGSISDNRLGGWYSYRASKAALNMMIKTAAIEIARKRPNAVCLALHPGTVETRLSDPYSSSRERFDPRECAQKLLKIIDEAGSDHTGSFLSYDGTHIPW